MPIIGSTELKQQTAYDVQHWSYCVRLAEKRQVRVHLLGVKRRLVACFGHHYAHHQEYEVKQQTAYDVRHWSYCVRLAEKRQVRVHLLGVKRRLVFSASLTQYDQCCIS
jgi:hypothetical protein